MPRRRRPQPRTPADLPIPPFDSQKKDYYPAGNRVYYIRQGEIEWRTGEIDLRTSSTALHLVIDDFTGKVNYIPVEYIRERIFLW